MGLVGPALVSPPSYSWSASSSSATAGASIPDAPECECEHMVGIWPIDAPSRRDSRIVDVAMSPHFRIPARSHGACRRGVRRTHCQRPSVPPIAAP
jgi:hypothetical protein